MSTPSAAASAADPPNTNIGTASATTVAAAKRPPVVPPSQPMHQQPQQAPPGAAIPAPRRITTPPNGGGGGSRRRRLFTIFGINQFHFSAQNTLDAIMTVCTIFVEKIVLILGPCLIVFASVIISALAHTFFTILLPLLNHLYQDSPSYYRHVIISLHISMVIFLLINVCFNYFMCVTTRNHGKAYDQVVRELAIATNFVFPEGPMALERFRRDFEDRMILRMRRRQAREREASQQRVAAAQAAKEQATAAAAAKMTLSMSSGSGSGSATGTTTTTTTANGNLSLDNPTPTEDVESCSSNSHTNNNGSGVITHRKTAASPSPSTTSPSSENGVGAKKKKGPILRRKNNNNNKPPIKQPSPKLVRNWMLMAPDEWGYCTRSNQPKPPRSHYDHVTKTLILCLDHYCPWMFNAIGYFNYRYFVNFLWFVQLSMVYGASITFIPFQNLSSPQYKEQVRHYRMKGEWVRLHPMTPFPYERMPLSLSFMLCLAIGVAVFCLASFHLYLILTAQTTIEFHGNWVARSKFYKEQKLRLQQQKNSGDNGDGDLSKQKRWKNPYDLGWKRNWQQVYGRGNPFMAVVVPSTRQPEYLPLPISGAAGRRRLIPNYQRDVKKEHSGNDDDDVETGQNAGIMLPVVEEEKQPLVASGETGGEGATHIV